METPWHSCPAGIWQLNASIRPGSKRQMRNLICQVWLWQVERIAHVAFQLAQKRQRRLCSVDKANVLDVSQLWRDVVTRIGQQYPDVELSHMYVLLLRAAGQLVCC